ncbi:hypothetical protein FACS189445_2030 [Spirochaetia bacterium]|nr:hypothetical protein FACS189445_2030 [Spirochaetia bacterium]
MKTLAVLHREIDTLPQDMDEPNAETIAAIEETRAMARGEIPSIEFDSAEAFLADLKS